jgi:hypothetical protein
MCGFEKKLYDYSISDFHGVKDAPTIHAFLPEGRTVTVARLTRGLENMILKSHGSTDFTIIRGVNRR